MSLIPVPTRNLRTSRRNPWYRSVVSGLFARLQRQHDCLLCLATLHDGTASSGRVCRACQTELPRPTPHACLQCAASIGAPGLCGECIADRPAFDATIAAFTYEFPVSPVISQLKYGARLALADWMADELAAAIRLRGDIGVDWVLPLPLSRERIAERGFNQAALIAAGLARQLALPLHRDELLRVRDTAPQASLDHDARWRNVRGAFAVDTTASSSGIAGQRIALVDDVMTTGATLDAAAGALKAAGAARVEAWVVARAARRSSATQGEATQDV